MRFLSQIYSIFNNKIALIFCLTLFLMFFSRILVEKIVISAKNQQKILIQTHSEEKLAK